MKNVLPRKMEVTIKTLTPLWTGGVDAGKCDRIHETGILGSLRWWMEVLVRGVGGNACDPTEQKCSYKNGLCEVCKIFGAEGQKRRFRLEVVQYCPEPDKNISPKIELQPYHYQYKDKQGREKTGTRIPTWYFPKNEENQPRSGRFTLQIQSLHPDFKPEIISGLIQFIADWSALGARPQMGFGVIQVEGSRIDTQCFCNWLQEIKGEHKDLDPELPSLQNIFLAKIQPKDSSTAFTEQDTFNLKYDLRTLFRPKAGKPDNLKSLRHFIMGAAPDDKKGSKAEDDRQAAKIKISRPYDDDKLMRVCGWIPTKSEAYKNDWNREKIVNGIYNLLKGKYTLHDWREMNSERDTVTPNESSTQVFLSSLLKPEK